MHDPGDHEREPDRLGHGDGVGDALVRMDATEEHQPAARSVAEREVREIDAVINGRGVAQIGVAVGVADRDVRDAVVVASVNGTDPIRRKTVDRRHEQRPAQLNQIAVANRKRRVERLVFDDRARRRARKLPALQQRHHHGEDRAAEDQPDDIDQEEAEILRPGAAAVLPAERPEPVPDEAVRDCETEADRIRQQDVEQAVGDRVCVTAGADGREPGRQQQGLQPLGLHESHPQAEDTDLDRRAERPDQAEFDELAKWWVAVVAPGLLDGGRRRCRHLTRLRCPQ